MLDAYPSTRLESANNPDHLGCGCNSRQGWIVATTHSQAEIWADTNLRRRGYQTFLPMHSVRRRDPVTPTLTRTVQRPVWSGYIFCHHDSRDSWRPIYETPGVRGIIRCGSEVQWVPDHAVEAVRKAVDGAEAFSAPSPLWKPGTPCSLASGAFYGLPAVVTELHGSQATIAIMMLGQLRQVTVDVECLTT